MRGRLTVAVAFLLGQSIVSADTNRWNLLSSLDFTQVFVRSECPAQTPCQDDELTVGDDSSGSCFIADDVVENCDVYAFSSIGWHGDAFAGYGPVAGDTPNGTGASFSGERISATLFEVSGPVNTSFGLEGAVEVAVFRFSGNPAVFDGVEAESVSELVDAGLIAAGDVLGSRFVDGSGELDLQVDVTGIPDEEIVLFGAGEGAVSVPVPAFTGIVSDTYGYCFAHSFSFFNDFPFPPLDDCADSDLQPFGSCSVACPTIGADSQVSGTPGWSIAGSTIWGNPGSVFSGSLQAEGVLTAPGTFTLTGSQTQNDPAIQPQLAVFRYAGDPSAFEGLLLFSVFELVDAGVIGQADVLFVKDFAPGEPSDFELEVDVGGVPAGEIAVFAAARSRTGAEGGLGQVPATTPGGLLALTLLLGVAAWAARRRRRSGS